jgi:hypothetical protein
MRKVILPTIISAQQYVCVPSRLITDNALSAFKCLHTILNQISKRPLCALIIDMTKTYAWVEWNSLHGCLCKFSFDQLDSISDFIMVSQLSLI